MEGAYLSRAAPRVALVPMGGGVGHLDAHVWNARARVRMCVRACACARAGMGARAPAYLLFQKACITLPGARYVYNGRLVRKGDGAKGLCLRWSGYV